MKQWKGSSASDIAEIPAIAMDFSPIGQVLRLPCEFVVLGINRRGGWYF